MILGFGQTEENYQKKVKKDIESIVTDCLANKFHNSVDVWFSEEIINNIEKKVEDYAKQTRDEEKEINKKEIKDRPERYSYVWISFSGRGSDLFFGIQFNHINSKHPMSPDGMAMYSVKDCVWISFSDFIDGLFDIFLLKNQPV